MSKAIRPPPKKKIVNSYLNFLLFVLQTSGGGIGGTGGGAGAIGGAMHHSGSGSGSHTPMDIDEGIEIPPEKVNKLRHKKEVGRRGLVSIFVC